MAGPRRPRLLMVTSCRRSQEYIASAFGSVAGISRVSAEGWMGVEGVVIHAVITDVSVG
jgi:hypothetical protein